MFVTVFVQISMSPAQLAQLLKAPVTTEAAPVTSPDLPDRDIEEIVKRAGKRFN